VYVPTPRLLLVAAFGAVPIVLAGSHTLALLLAGLWLIGTCAVAAVDGRDTVVEGLSWTRVADQKLSLGVANGIELHLANTGNRVVQFAVRDTVPLRLQPRGEAFAGDCAAHGEWAGRYTAVPIARGDYALGPVTARYLGPMGLVWRQRRHDVVDTVRVYPNLLALSQYDAFVRRGLLQEIGLRNSRRWGAGTEFERLRDYTPDDEYRRISWAATARRRTPVVVDYETERSQNVIIMLDTGRLMATKLPLRGDGDVLNAQALTRLDHAVNAALMLGYVSEGVGDRVGIVAFGDVVQRFVPPRAGRGHFLAIADALYDVREEPAEPNYADAFSFLSAHVRRRSLVVLFTDIGAPETGQALVRSMAVASRRHLCVAVTLRDPALQALAVQPPDEARTVYERAVARLWLDDRTALLRRLAARGVLTVDTSADAISTDVVNRYLEVKARASL
jgi:uncharacterized protein (DUF58 family)